MQTTKDTKKMSHVRPISVNVDVPSAIRIVNHFKVGNLYSDNVKMHYNSGNVTCDLGGDGTGHRGAKAFIGGGFEGENIGGSRVETHKQVMGLITQFEDLSPLRGQISTRV